MRILVVRLFFQCEGKYPLQVHKMTSGQIMKKGASNAESAVTQIGVYRSLLRQDFLSL